MYIYLYLNIYIYRMAFVQYVYDHVINQKNTLKPRMCSSWSWEELCFANIYIQNWRFNVQPFSSKTSQAARPQTYTMNLVSKWLILAGGQKFLWRPKKYHYIYISVHKDCSKQIPLLLTALHNFEFRIYTYAIDLLWGNNLVSEHPAISTNGLLEVGVQLFWYKFNL